MRTISRHYAYAGERRIHYRRSGTGPPLVMLHASPGSSYALEMLMRQLALRHTVIALDTPGYGESEALADEAPSMTTYATALGETLSALNLDRVDLYGSHTGAKIAMEFAIQQPGRVRRLVLDGVGVYDKDEAADLLANYTPSLEPDLDGTHLMRAWQMRRDMALFWPWFRKTPEARLLRGLPTAEQLHDHVVDFLRAGPGYWKGYHAAFKHDGVASMRKLSVTSILLTRASDPLGVYLSNATDLPASLLVETTALTDSAFADRISAYLLDPEGEPPLPDAPPPAPVEVQNGAVRRDYAQTTAGQLLTRRSGTGSGRPLVLFHASPYSSKGMERYLLALGDDRPVITFDNPGNGDSTSLPGTPEVWDLADVLIEAIDELGFDEYDIIGSHTGALIAIEVGIMRGNRVKHAILDGITLMSEEMTDEYLARYIVPLHVSSDGGHLFAAWSKIRDMALFWPWFSKTTSGSRKVGLQPADVFHAGFMEFLKGGKTYHQSYRAAFAYPTASRLPVLKVPTLHCTGPADPLREYVPEGRRLTPNALARIHLGSATPEAFASTAGLYRSFLADEPLPAGPEE